MSKIGSALLAAALLVGAGTAHAAPAAVQGRVLQVQAFSPSGTGGAFGFNISFPAGTPAQCTNGWFTVSAASMDQLKAFYALALASRLSGQQVYVVYETTTCQVSGLTITNW